MHIHTHTGVRAHTWSQRVTVALVYSALPPSLALLSSSPSSLSCCVSLPTNVSATVGQWLILVCLAKCLQDVCLGCLFPPPFPTPAPRMSWSCGSRVACPPPPPTPMLSQLFLGGEECLIITKGQRLPELTEIFFSDQSHFLSLPSATISMRCLFSVCWWCMMGEVLTQHWGAVTLHCQRSWLAYHSLHWEEIHHHSRQGFPSLGPIPCLLLLGI